MYVPCSLFPACPRPCARAPCSVLRARDVDPSLTRGGWGIEYGVWSIPLSLFYCMVWCGVDGEANGVTILALSVILTP